jgi:hypothetical protein
MLFVASSCGSGAYTGSGFLVGPQTMVTALHVIQDEDGTSCSSTAKQEGTGKVARISDYTAWPADDLAVAHLSVPLAGFFFQLAANAPTVRERIIGLGYSLGNPLSLNQGTIAELDVIGGVPYVFMNLFGGHGSSGGPIINLEGQAIGLTQLGQTNGSTSAIASIDFALLTSGGKRLCVGAVAREGANTLCGLIKAGNVPGSPPAPKPSAPSQLTPHAFGISYTPRPLYDSDTSVHVSLRTNLAAPEADRYYVELNTLVRPLPKTCAGASRPSPPFSGGRNEALQVTLKPAGTSFCPGPAIIVVGLSQEHRIVGSFDLQIRHRGPVVPPRPTVPTINGSIATLNHSYELFPHTAFDSPLTHSYSNAKGTVTTPSTATTHPGCLLNVTGLQPQVTYAVYLQATPVVKGDLASTTGPWQELGTFEAPAGVGTFRCLQRPPRGGSLSINVEPQDASILISDVLGGAPTATAPAITTPPSGSATQWITNLQAALAAYTILRQPPSAPAGPAETAQDALDGFRCGSGNAEYSTNISCSWTASVMWGGWGNSPPDPNGGPWYGGPESAYITRSAQGFVTITIEGHLCTLRRNVPGTCT